jgi:hypothetical protein
MPSINPVATPELVRDFDGLGINDRAVMAVTITYEPALAIEFKSEVGAR